jgi:predicted extracellular nuclease
MRRSPSPVLALLGLMVGCSAQTEDGDPQFAPYDGGPLDAAAPASPDAVSTPEFEPPNTLTVATYNVENLFDLVDDPNAEEGEFTPGRTWDANRLGRRLTDLADAFTAIAADVVLVNEVENLEVLTQLRDAIRAGGGPAYPYLAIAPSRDPRGIDVSLLSRYPVLLQLGRPINRAHTCTHVETGEPTTLDGAWPEARPILQVELNLDADPEADLVLLGNHWKAKGRGSFPCDDDAHRLRSGLHLRALIETLAAARPEMGLIALGDFNTWDFEAPLAEALDARLDLEAQALLYNAWGDAGVLERNTRNDNDWNRPANSSYQFDGVWSRLDHILLSGSLLDGRAGWRLASGSVESVADPRFLGPGGAPRSWSSETGAGYSDHLPVRLRLTRVP